MKTLVISLLGLVALPALAATGGPDAFGSTYIDSNEVGGPAYFFEDISATGLNLGLTDDSHLYVPLSAPISFYGVPMSGIAVGSNGNIAFEDQYLGLSNTCPIPGSTFYTPQQLIATYWDDLNPGAGGAVYFEERSAPTRVIVQWNEVPVFGTSNLLTFQAVLFEDGTVHLAYDSMAATGDGATIGVQYDPTVGLQYLDCNTAATVAGGLLVEFTTGACVGTDNDQDGFDSCTDCDDNDNGAFPGAPEFPGDGIDNDCDGITDLTLEVNPGLSPGAPVSFNVRGAQPGATIRLARSTVFGATDSNVGPCPAVLAGECLDIVQPTLMFTGTANASGRVSFSGVVPASVPLGTDVFFEAVQVGATIDESNVVAVTVQ